LKRGPGNKGFVSEALLFPGGKHDDQVDTASGGLKMLAEVGGKLEVY
jgi:phage terminase large subunit-like protein